MVRNMSDQVKEAIYLSGRNLYFSYDSVKEVIRRKDPTNISKLTDIDRVLLQEMIMFLEPYADATRDLEGEDSGTICYVMPTVRYLMCILKVGLLTKYVKMFLGTKKLHILLLFVVLHKYTKIKMYMYNIFSVQVTH